MHRLLALLLALTTLTARAGTLQAVAVGSRIDVTIDGAFFTSYRFAEDEKYPFFFPVNGPSGASVTSMRNGEFPHHSSLFFGCDQVNGGNYWQEGLERGRIDSEGARIEVAKGPQVVITDRCVWTRPGADAPFRDNRRFTISAPAAGLRQIDVEIALEALTNVVIRKTNHSLFSVRMDPDLTPRCSGTLVNAEGDLGEKATFGKASAWMDCSGRRGSGAVEGLALLQHPSNPWYPSPWFTRDYGFLSPTPMYWPKDNQATHLAKGETLTLRYRILVHGGDAAQAGVAEQFKAYAQPPAKAPATP